MPRPSQTLIAVSRLSSSSSPPAGTSHGVVHGRVLYVLLVLLNVAVILLFYYYFWRLFSKKSRPTSDGTVATAAGSSSSSSSAGSSPSRSTRKERLDPRLLSSLAAFVYTSADRDEKLECVLCLSEFKDGENGWLLPPCGHSFHAECVEAWFRSHSTCPLCRSPVEPKAPFPDTDSTA